MSLQEADHSADFDLDALVRPEEGSVSRRIFVDPGLFRRELEQIFARSWLYVGHASEVPSAGDYVTRMTGLDPVIVCRTEDDEIGVYLNSCRHRGMQVCRVDRGNTSHFRCPYHGWTYKNNGALAGVPALNEGYGPGFDRSRLGLIRPPHIRVLHGLIFINWDPDAISLEEYLGDALWYLDISFGRTDDGNEVVGSPQRSISRMNWKLGADNFVGDGYHVAMTHRHALELGLFGGGTMMGHTIHTENGHGIRMQNFPAGAPLPKHLALPKEVTDSMEKTLTPEQRDAISEITVVHGNIFPNFSYVEALFTTTGDPDIPPVSYLNPRQWQPVSPTETELVSWLMVSKETPDAWREAARVTFIRSLGLAGTFDPDDHEVLTNITRSNQGVVAQRHDFNFELGMHAEVDQEWSGPGTAFQQDYNETGQRAFYRQWRRTMTAGVPVKG